MSPTFSQPPGNATKLQGVPVSAATPATNQLLEFDGTSWVPTTVTGTPTPATAGLTFQSNTTPAGAWEQGSFNVLAFGADPTGAANSTTAFNAAHAAAVAFHNGSVYVPAGSYKLSTALTSPWLCSIIGDGPNLSILNFSAQAGACFVPQAITAQGVQFNNTDASGTGICIPSSSSGASLFNECYFYGSVGGDVPAVIATTGTHALWFTNCIFGQITLATGQKGIVHIGGAVNSFFRFSDCSFYRSNATADATMGLFYVDAGTLNFQITGSSNQNASLPTTYNYGVYIAAGTSDRYIVQGNDFTEAATAAVNDGGSGTNKLVGDNPIRTIDGAQLTTGTIPTGRFPGGAFNGASELVQLTAATKYPALDGSLITNLPGLTNPMTQQGQQIVGVASGAAAAAGPGQPGQALVVPLAASYFVAYDGAHNGTTGLDTGLPSGNPAAFSWSGIVNFTNAAIMGAWAYGTLGSTNALALVSADSTHWGIYNDTQQLFTSNWVITAINDGANHHVAVTYDGTSWRLYIDGVVNGTVKTNSLHTPNVTLSALALGGDNASDNGWNGKQAYSAFFATQLSGAQVLAEYNAIAAGTYVSTVQGHGPVRFFQNQEQSGTTAFDTGSSPVNLTYTAGVTVKQSGSPIPTSAVPVFTQVVGDTQWTNIVGGVGYQNSWVDSGGALALSAFRKDGFGRVEFRASMKSGASASIAFTLPVGYRPAATQTFTGLAELVASNVSTEITVASTGAVTVTFVGALTGNVFVTGSFWNGQ